MAADFLCKSGWQHFNDNSHQQWDSQRLSMLAADILVSGNAFFSVVWKGYCQSTTEPHRALHMPAIHREAVTLLLCC